MQEEVDEERRKEGRMRQEEEVVASNGANGAGRDGTVGMPDTLYTPISSYRVRVDLPDALSKELRDLQ